MVMLDDNKYDPDCDGICSCCGYRDLCYVADEDDEDDDF